MPVLIGVVYNDTYSYGMVKIHSMMVEIWKLALGFSKQLFFSVAVIVVEHHLY